MYEQGKPVGEIAKHFGEKEATIYYWLRSQSAVREAEERPEIQRAIDLYKTGLSAREVAEQMGLKSSTVGQWLAEKGVRRSRKNARILRVKTERSNKEK
jgi:transposase